MVATFTPSPITTADLTRYEPKRELAINGLYPKSPTTPNEWFRERFPQQASIYGSPFFEAKERTEEVLTKVSPISLNPDFFAAILGGDDRLGHQVVYFEPEMAFYFRDADGIFKPTTEEKLEALLRAYLIRCAEELPGNVQKYSLFLEFRSDQTTKPIIRRAKSILAADETFFSAESQHERKNGLELHERIARVFVQQILEAKPGSILTLTDAYGSFSDLGRSRGLAPLKRALFKGLMVPLVKERFSVALRNDLIDKNQRQQCGWKNITVTEEGS